VMSVMGLSLPGKKKGSWNPLNSLEPPLYFISIIIIIIVFPKKLANKHTTSVGTIIDREKSTETNWNSA